MAVNLGVQPMICGTYNFEEKLQERDVRIMNTIKHVSKQLNRRNWKNGMGHGWVGKHRRRSY